MAAPFLIFLRNEDTQPDESNCRDRLMEWILATYGDAEFHLSKSLGTTIPGERENGFQDTYIREVFLTAKFPDNRVWQIKMETESSNTSTFENIGLYSFYAMQFTFMDGPRWAEMMRFLSDVSPLMKTLQFYHHTFAFYSDQLVHHCKEIEDQEGINALHEHVFNVTKAEIIQQSAEHGAIEIQNSPDLDIEALLAAAPKKNSIHSIAIQNNGLSKWPNALFDFTQLNYLYIYNNPLLEIDERIGQLKELKLVNVHSCPFGKDPDKLNSFKALLPEGCEVQYF